MEKQESYAVEFNGFLWFFKTKDIETSKDSTNLQYSWRDLKNFSPQSSSSAIEITNTHVIAQQNLSILCVNVIGDVNGIKRLVIVLSDKSNPTKLFLCSFLSIHGKVSYDVSTMQVELASATADKLSFAPNAKPKVHKVDRNCANHTKYHSLFLDDGSYRSTSYNAMKCIMNKNCTAVNFNVKRGNVFLLNGPNVALVDSQSIIFTTRSTSSENFVVHSLSVMTDNSNCVENLEILLLTILGDSLLIFLKLTPPSPQTGTTLFYLLCLNYVSSKQSWYDVGEFIPSFYAESLRCFHILDMEIVHERTLDGLSNECRDDYEDKMLDMQQSLSSDVLLCTGDSQLYYLENGKYVNRCQIPFPNCKSITSFDLSDCDSLVAVLSSDNKCAIIKQREFQVKVVVDNVGQMFVDDFMLTGGEQLLLLSATNTDNFILTDLNGIHIDTLNVADSAGAGTSETESQGMTAAVNALSARLQAGKQQVHEMDMKLLKQTNMLKDACEDIQRMAGTSHQADSLAAAQRKEMTMVPFISGDSFPTDSPPLPIEGVGVRCGPLWTRVVDRKLVVGSEIFNGTKKRMYNPVLYTVNNTSACQMKATSSCIRHILIEPGCTSKSQVQSQSVPASVDSKPASKKRKFSDTLPSDSRNARPSRICINNVDFIETGFSATVYLVTDTPEVGLHKDFKLEVILKWTETCKDSAEDEVCALEKKRCQMKPCGSVTLKFADLMKQPSVAELADCEDVLTVIAFLVSRRHVSLEALSRSYDCSQRVTVAMTELGCSLQPLIDTFITRLNNSGSYVGVKISPCSKTKADLILYYQKESHMFTFVHLLCGHIGDDVVIRPSRKSSDGALSTYLSSVDREITHLSSSLRRLLSSSEGDNQQGHTSGDADVMSEFEKSRTILDKQSEACPQESVRSLLISHTPYLTQTDKLVLNVFDT